MESIDNVLQLSQEYSHNVWEPGVALVEFVFSILRQLLEATLDDEGLLDHLPRWLSISHDMDIDEHLRINEMTTEQKEVMRRKNTTLAIEIIVNFLQNKMTSRLLSLVHRNMPSYWRSFKHQMQLIASKSSILKNLTHINADTLLSAMENIHGVVSCNAKSVIPAGSQVAFDGGLPIDLILEDALDGGHVATFSAIEMITVGNLRHLIVEACIARNLLDTSAYYWPGYVNACSNQIPASISNQVDGWSSLMKGSKLTPTLADFLAATPASRNTIIFITKLLSPGNNLISRAPLLNVLLIGISSADYVHIFSLHGFGSKQTQFGLIWFGLLTKSPSFGAGDNDSRWCHSVTERVFTMGI